MNPARSSGPVVNLMPWTRGRVVYQIRREKSIRCVPRACPRGEPAATLVLGAGRRKGTLFSVLGERKAVAGEEDGAEGTPPPASGGNVAGVCQRRTCLLVAVQGP